MSAQPKPVLTHAFPLLVALLLLFAGAMSAHHLDSDGIWLDEWWSQYGAGAPQLGAPLSLAGIWERQAVEDPYNLPGFPWLLMLWSQLVGWSEFAGRALAWLTGLLAIALIARLGKDEGGVWLGLSAALVASSSAWLIYYMHELRTFSIVAALTALLLLLYRRAMSKPQPTWTLIAIGLTCAALVYLHYFAALPAVALGLWHLAQVLRRRPARTWWGIAIAILLGGLTLLPWLGIALNAMASMQSQQRVVMTPERLFGISGSILFVFSSGSTLLFALLAVLQRPKGAWRYWGVGALLFALILAAYTVFAVGEVRYAIALFPFLALLAGYGIVALIARGIPLWLMAGLLLGSSALTASSPMLWRAMQRTLPQPFREVARYFAPLLTDADSLVYILAPDADTRGVHEAPFRYYFDALPGTHRIMGFGQPTRSIAAADLATAIGDAPAVWITHMPQVASSDALLIDALVDDLAYLPCSDWIKQSTFASRPFARFPAAANTQDITIASYFNESQSVVSAWLGISIPGSTPANTYSVGVHLLDANGVLATQADFPLPSTGQSCQLTQLALPQLPSGEYTAQVVVYAWANGERIAFEDADGQLVNALVLGSVTIP
jgi:hypothetical protein